MNQKSNDGFLIVATRLKSFYIAGVYLAESIKDFWPEAQICFVCDEWMCDGREDVADYVLYPPRENDYRGKLWGMANTPFDRTLYLDADMVCEHEDLKIVFDQLEDYDMVFTSLNEDRDDVFKNRYFPAGKFELNGGVVLYNSSRQHVKDFMQRWWELYTKQHNHTWWPTDPETGEWDLVNYGNRNEMRWWDQFTLWWLLNKEEKWSDMNIGIFDDDLRWNYYTRYPVWNLYPKNPVIFSHHSTSLKKDRYEEYAFGDQMRTEMDYDGIYDSR